MGTYRGQCKLEHSEGLRCEDRYWTDRRRRWTGGKDAGQAGGALDRLEGVLDSLEGSFWVES